MGTWARIQFVPAIIQRSKWMEIRVLKESVFRALPVPKEKPIVIYGTSIAQAGFAHTMHDRQKSQLQIN